MATESSAVFVAVRVRPFTAKEDPFSCTITVPNNNTITLTDVAVLVGKNTSASGGASSAVLSNTTWSNSGGFTQASSGHSSAPFEHSFSFDKIFWSVPNDVLPLDESSLTNERCSLSLVHSQTNLPGTTSTLQDPADSSLVFPSNRLSSNNSHAGLPSDALYGSPNISTLNIKSRFTTLPSPPLSQRFPCLARTPAYDCQETVYRFIGPRIYEAIMKGYNACLFAYGQTGSGKSYSMIGETESFSCTTGSALKKKQPLIGGRGTLDVGYGIIPRLSADLFRCMREERERDEAVSYTVELSFLEIYCEKVRDLLVGRAGIGANASSNTTSLRIRQHPINGPYVEGLSHIRVRDTESVIKNLANGMRDRVTAETKMNEHSSRSHAILQLKITKVTAVANEVGVLPKTCVSKASLVDLAGSERVSQSGVVGTRFEETKNINLSLSTLGRIIQQLSDKQSGKRVIPAYRESALTWLLSDSLGGNSKTILLATVAPSAYCYAQTLNTLRFAGVAKKIINIASVNEDQHLEKLVLDLRQQIVRLTLQLETGKAAEVHLAEINFLKAERDELRVENNSLKAKEAVKVDPSVMHSLRKRVSELEEENAILRKEKLKLQQHLLSSTSSLREELSKARAELIKIKSANGKEMNEVIQLSRAQDQASRTSDFVTASNLKSRTKGQTGVGSTVNTSADSFASLTTKQQQPSEEVCRLTKQVRILEKSLKDMKRSACEAKDSAEALKTELDSYRVRYDECKRQLAHLHERMQNTRSMSELTQSELVAAKERLSSAAVVAHQSARDKDNSFALQLSKMRENYLSEKQANVELLLRVSVTEKEQNHYKNQIHEKSNDINELELMLVEEMETSERCHLRMRFHRTVAEIQQSFIRKLCFDSVFVHGVERGKKGSHQNTCMGDLPSSSRVYSAMEVASYTSEGVTPQSTLASLDQSQKGAAELVNSNRQIGKSSLELANSHLRYECFFNESHHRGEIERDYLKGVMGLLSQHARLQWQLILHQREALTEVREQLALGSDDINFIKQRFKERNKNFSLIQEEKTATEKALHNCEMENIRLVAKLKAEKDRAVCLEENLNTVVEKLAGLQNAYDTLEEWRHLALKAAAHEEGVVFSDSDGNFSTASKEGLSTGSLLSAKEVSQAGVLKQLPKEEEEGLLLPSIRVPNHITSDMGSLSSLMKNELRASLDKVRFLESQNDELRTKLGAMHASKEREATLHIEYREQQRLEQDLLRRQVENLYRTNTHLMKEMDTVVQDCNQRVEQQQTMVVMLRKALNEEADSADRRQERIHVLEKKLRTLEDNVETVTEQKKELERSNELLQGRYNHLQDELSKLQKQYSEMRDQLIDMGDRAPELYVLLERGISEDTSAWIDKIHREKANLERQKKDAQNLRRELLEHVRLRNSNLQDVQRQLEEIVESSALLNGELGSTTSYANHELQQGETTNLAMSEVSNIHTENSLTSIDA